MRRVGPKIERDTLSEMLQAARLRAAVFCRTEFTAPWGFSVGGRDFATFHIVVSGRCCLEVAGVPGRAWLGVGDLAMLPHGSAHVVRDAPSSPATALEDLLGGEQFDRHGGTLRAGGGGKAAVMACGAFHFEDSRTNPLLRALPPVLCLRSGSRGADRWQRLATRFLASELKFPRPGADSVVTRLAEILFVEAVRSYFASAEAREGKLTLALTDPRVGAALALIHRQPDAQWSVETLAKSVAMSRTAFAVRFTGLVGESPMRYLTRCRMSTAATLLRSSKATIPDIAHRVGYESEVAFGRAFKRQMRETPAAFRQKT